MFGITTDLWTNDVTSTLYVTITLRVIDSNWELQSIILATLPMFEEKMAINNKSLITKVFHDFF